MFDVKILNRKRFSHFSEGSSPFNATAKDGTLLLDGSGLHHIRKLSTSKRLNETEISHQRRMPPALPSATLSCVGSGGEGKGKLTQHSFFFRPSQPRNNNDPRSKQG